MEEFEFTVSNAEARVLIAALDALMEGEITPQDYDEAVIMRWDLQSWLDSIDE